MIPPVAHSPLENGQRIGMTGWGIIICSSTIRQNCPALELHDRWPEIIALSGDNAPRGAKNLYDLTHRFAICGVVQRWSALVTFQV